MDCLGRETELSCRADERSGRFDLVVGGASSDGDGIDQSDGVVLVLSPLQNNSELPLVVEVWVLRQPGTSTSGGRRSRVRDLSG